MGKNINLKRRARVTTLAAGVTVALAVLTAPQSASALTFYKGAQTFHKTNGVRYYNFSQLIYGGTYTSAYASNGPSDKRIPAGHAGATARLFTSGGSLVCQQTGYNSQPLGPSSVTNARSCNSGKGSFYSQGVAHDWWGGGYQNVTMARTITQTARAEPIMPLRVNDAGKTYGSALVASSPEQEPDLIAVTSTSGRPGFVKKSDLDATQGVVAESPEDALAWQVTHEAQGFLVPVFESDGTTVVGRFAIGVGEDSSS